MSKLITFFLFLFIGSAILSAVMEGGQGIVTTPLQASITADNLTIPVVSTKGFLDADYVIIEREKILYSSKTDTTFAVWNSGNETGRGYDGTEAKAHMIIPSINPAVANKVPLVYTAEANTINNALGFDIATTTDTMGLWATITIPFYFMTKTLPRIVMMNFSFLTGQLAIIGWFFFAAGAGLLITLALALAGGRRI